MFLSSFIYGVKAKMLRVKKKKENQRTDVDHPPPLHMDLSLQTRKHWQVIIFLEATEHGN